MHLLTVVRLTVWKLMLALSFGACLTSAEAAEVPLRSLMVQSGAPISVADVQEAVSRSGALQDQRWTWLSLTHPSALEALPGHWHLLIDQCRFKEIVIVVTTHDGSTRHISRSATDLQRSWVPGGLLRFTIEPDGRDIRGLHIGFRDLDDIQLMRKVTAVSSSDAMKLSARWLVLMGLFAGLLISAFIYNAFIYAGQRSPFLRWYLAWLSASLAYGLTWSNLTALLIPGAVGPIAVRVDYILVGLVVGFGSLFLLSVLENGKVPARLKTTVQLLGISCMVVGAFASDERMLPAPLTDGLLNIFLLLCAVATVGAISVAIRRGSRIVWLYLIGWTPVILVFLARSARNFGLLPQNDYVDMATFAAIGFESLVFSLAIASRFNALQAELLQVAKVQSEALQRAAHTDHLTGLGNRARFSEQLQELYASGSDFVLYLIDVDFLKEVNDRLGHDGGDGLLRSVAARLAEVADAETYVSRVGGDEFAILAQGNEQRQRQLRALLGSIQGDGWIQNGASGSISLSVGSADSRRAASARQLFKNADLALYKAKQSGRGQHRRFDRRFAAQLQTKSNLISEAHRGIARSEFFLAYQPVVELNTRRIASEEALLRWNHPYRGTITPTEFMDLLNEEEIARPLQQRVLALAFDELRRRGPHSVPLAVNFTGLDLRGVASAKRLLSNLKAAAIPPQCLCIEVTERVLLESASEAPVAALRLLHDAGVRIALDDFGTGFASLVHLRNVPVDTLKIDRTFVGGLLNEHESEQIVRAIIALAKGLGKTVIAEGIETAEQAIRLLELGCGYGQGFYFGRPAARKEIETERSTGGSVTSRQLAQPGVR
jgi:diguanylate cyclase (GGDEF)-like protein